MPHSLFHFLRGETTDPHRRAILFPVSFSAPYRNATDSFPKKHSSRRLSASLLADNFLHERPFIFFEDFFPDPKKMINFE